MAPALLIVDLQRYYLDPEAAYCAYQEAEEPGVLDHLRERCSEVVLPAVAELQQEFRARDWPVIFLGLCGTREDRTDLIPVFLECYRSSEEAGFPGFYPLVGEELASIAEEIAPLPGETVLHKTTFSGFNSTDLHEKLQALGVDTLVMTGIVTSLCVETTARDAADHGYRVLMVEDAQADFSPNRHHYSLQLSKGVCGEEVVEAAGVIDQLGSRP